jgi:4-amino-4-deoxy-L-arabinose transferase-like glycosyltransferase
MTGLDALPRRGPSVARIAVLLAIVALAAGLRLYRLGDLPPGLFIDQAQYGLDAYRISRGETFPVFVEGPTKERGREPLFMYLMAGIFLVAGPTPVTIKLTSALIGIATVIVTWLAASRWFGERAGLCSAALLAVSRWHITFSRMGFRAILAPLWMSLVALALWWLVTRRTRGAAILFGVVVGAGFYTYPAYWAAPPVLALVAAAALWTRRSHLHEVARQVKPLVVAGVVSALVVMAPLVIYATAHADDLLARAREVALVNEGDRPPDPDKRATTVLDGVQRVLFMLHLRGDIEPRHNIPGRPMLDLVSGLLFLGGLIATAKAEWPLPHKLGLMSFWLLPLVPSAVTLAAPNALRAVGAIPAVCVIAGVGLDAAARQLERLRGRAAPLAAVALIAVALGTAAVVNARTYFVEWASQPILPTEFSADIPRFVEYLREVGAGADVVVCPYVYSSPNVHFLTLRQDPPFHPLDGIERLLAAPLAAPLEEGGPSGPRPASMEVARDRVFVCDEPATNALLHRLYPDAQEVGRYAIYTMRTGRILRVPAASLWPRLPPAEEEQARYFIQRMNDSFLERSRAW